ncbi:hypothetical protein SAMN06265348_104294 [Pedobacter westerhofensis]|uniref:Uncharacterized protein n=1 Tax=Pedobacter westerhofensis TaxID=425512 RepID=A0A521CXS2_9SPHI|nr:hypothetical protein [Pedobacter westerhofensis]SMO64229.1 hypothetical protein SAMN06265348_104294 [Pedobacter westerhofensis]
MKKLNKGQIWDYFILVARCLLAGLLLSYGLAKISGHQFGVPKEVMNMALKDIDLFRVSWYLADHEPFKSFIGISQMLTAMLILYNRTVILGTFISIPIWLNILVWDITFMGLMTPFTILLPFYLLLTVLILLHYKTQVIPALQLCTRNTTIKYKYPIWAYLILPVLAFCLQIIAAIPGGSIRWIVKMLNL